MPVTVHIPTPLRSFVGNKEEAEINMEGSVKQVLICLMEEHESLRKHLFSEDGKIRNFVNIYVNDEDIRYQKGDETLVKSGDNISIIPSIAGG